MTPRSPARGDRALRLVVALLALLPAGCLDRVFEAPYVLATGLGEIDSVCPSLDGGLLLATPNGTFTVDGNGVATLSAPGATRAVSAHPGRVYHLGADRITWDGGGADVPGAIDLLAGYGPLLVLSPTELDTLDPATGTRAPLATGFADARAVALGPAGTYLVVTATSLLSVAPAADPAPTPGTVTPLLSGLVDARAAAIDARARVYVIQGAPPELWRVDDGALTRIARWLDDPRDLHFGVGGLLPPENAYIAGGDGTLDYVRPPP